MNLTSADIDIATRTVYGEARGESTEGKIWVASILRNRWRAGYGIFRRDDTLASACLRHRQFSVWDAGDANFAAIQRVGPSDPIFLECMKALLQALTEPDRTEGATLYHTAEKPAWRDTWPPAWAVRSTPVATVGHHIFYKE